jgi:hypothetical protein
MWPEDFFDWALLWMIVVVSALLVIEFFGV